MIKNIKAVFDCSDTAIKAGYENFRIHLILDIGSNIGKASCDDTVGFKEFAGKFLSDKWLFLEIGGRDQLYIDSELLNVSYWFDADKYMLTGFLDILSE